MLDRHAPTSFFKARLNTVPDAMTQHKSVGTNTSVTSQQYIYTYGFFRFQSQRTLGRARAVLLLLHGAPFLLSLGLHVAGLSPGALVLPKDV